MSTSHARPGTVGWFEITATDPMLDQKFYQELLGWGFESFGSEDDFHTVAAPGAATSMGALRRGDQDSLCIGIVCSDVETTLGRLEGLGAATVERPRRTPSCDVHAVVSDVRGNLIGLVEPSVTASPDEAPATPAPNATAFFEIGTTDLDATREFYSAAFGWTLERDEAAEGVAYYSIAAPDAPTEIGGVLDLSGMDGMTDYAIPGLLVEDVPDVLERCEAAGGTRVMGPISDGNGLTIGQFVDPVGNRWSSFALPAGG